MAKVYKDNLFEVSIVSSVHAILIVGKRPVQILAVSEDF